MRVSLTFELDGWPGERLYWRLRSRFMEWRCRKVGHRWVEPRSGPIQFLAPRGTFCIRCGREKDPRPPGAMTWEWMEPPEPQK